MIKKPLLAGLLVAASLLGFGGPALAAPTVSLGISSWIGYGPIFIAKHKGFFAKEGVNVDLHRIEEVANRRSALAAGAIQGFPTTPDTQVSTAAAGVPVAQVMALDESYGADGIVAKKSIKTIEDLKGKTVGLETGGGASFFWFLYLLNKHHMTLSDIQVKNMSAGAAGAAFAANKLDAAVTWQPWLTTAENTSFGHVLISSKATPGVITDTLGFRQNFVKAHPKQVQAIVNGVFDAMKYMHTHHKQAFAIMAKAMNQTPKQFTKAAKGVRWYGIKKNRAYFGTDQNPGPLYDLCRMAANLFKTAGVIEHKPDIGKLIDPRFVHAAK